MIPVDAPFEIRSINDPVPETAPGQTWLWNGYLRSGGITVLTSQWKSGKTTLVSLLLSRLATGGALAGRPVRPGRAAVVTEEPLALWQERHRRMPIPADTAFYVQPFPVRIGEGDWEWLMLKLNGDLGRPYDLVVIDPLAGFLPGRPENTAAVLLEILTPLRNLTARGTAVLLLHHPRKGAPAGGQAARGSGALAGMADVVIEMDWFGRSKSEDRRRTLVAYSRYPETPRRLVIELTPDGTDYQSLGDLTPIPEIGGWRELVGVLEQSAEPMTRAEILAAWPADADPPELVSLWRRLDRAVRAGDVIRSGPGRRNAPYVYELPGAGPDPGAA
ncbi:MAG TPA: AAA family ATPase [Gemmataceae bacterium]|jgi:hypothetical protein|nr:AAA family ATPase [Gemmataceae bacterium]